MRRGARAAAHEVNFFYQVIRRDLSSTVIPSLFFSLAAWRASGAEMERLLPAAGRSVLYISFFVFTFCLSNQITGLEEDRINKPDRPLPRGMVSVRGAWVRWVLGSLAYDGIAWSMGVLKWALMWQALGLLHNVAGGSRIWFVKNICNGLGTLVMLAAAWEVVAPMQPNAWLWLLFLAGTVGTLAAVQDLRDIEGDKLSKRRTLPMVIGVWPARIASSLGFTALTVVSHVLVMRIEGPTVTALVLEGAMAFFSLGIAGRVLLLRTPQADHTTYMFFTYWFCAALAGSFFIL